jgi:hypothetical protein
MAVERSLRSVPPSALAILIVGLCAQGLWHHLRPPPEACAAALPSPPSAGSLALFALGDPEALARLLMLWLQAHDNQPGISLPFKDLDYDKVVGWLGRILDLDPRAQYPLLAAARLYAEVPDEAKQRAVLEFVYRRFLEDPDRRWPWLAHGVFVARHRLHDPRLAQRFAEALARHATGPEVPHWVQQMRIFVLADLGEVEAARALIRALLDSGRITDPHEIRFLSERLREMQIPTPEPPPARP